VRHKLALFGSGVRSLYDFGPNRRLHAQPVARYRVVGGGRLHATLNEAKTYRRIRKRAAFLPTHVTGRITGGRRGARRDIAVAVNGRIWGLSRTAYIRGNPREYYSVLVSEDVLAQGRNRIQVFSVGHRRGHTVLRRLR
jgi:hypothetical protein